MGVSQRGSVLGILLIYASAILLFMSVGLGLLFFGSYIAFCALACFGLSAVAAGVILLRRADRLISRMQIRTPPLVGEAGGIDSSNIKTYSLGLLVGLALWGFLTFLLLAGKSWYFSYGVEAGFVVKAIAASLIYFGEINPVLLGGGVVGYSAGKPGLIVGGAIGAAHGIVIYARRSGGGFHPGGEILDTYNFAMMYASTGVLGGYLGLKLAQIRRRRSSPPDQELIPSDLNRRTKSVPRWYRQG